jgi:hypothetical protein
MNMSAINPAQAALTRWMHPSVARSWMAQITRYRSDRRPVECHDGGAAEFHMLLSRDWVTLDFGPSGRPQAPH